MADQEMTAYYNENDEGAAAWLEQLIAEGHVAPGHVDRRSIVDVTPNDLRGFAQCHFFAGIGGWSLALRSTGWPDHFPVWTGSCPCQPFSAAGKRAGFADERHLWPFWRYLIAQRRPAIVFGEQVAAASDWLGLVRGDLEALEYVVGAMPVEAASAGADHLRDRFWFVAHADEFERRIGNQQRAGQQPQHEQDSRTRDRGNMADDDDTGLQGRPLLSECVDQRVAGADGVEHAARIAEREQNHQSDAFANGRETWPVSGGPSNHEWVIGADGKARRVKSGIRLLADGFPERMGLLRGFGNAIDPRAAAAFIRASVEAMTMARAG